VKANLCLIVFAAVLVAVAGCSQDDMVVPMNALSTLGVYGVNGVAGQYCTTLYAGQDIDAGNVCAEVVDNGATEQLCITYTTTGGWELVEAHLWVGKALADMPQTRKGNPQVGQFPYHSGDITGQTTYTFCVDLSEFGGEDALCGEELLAAAHAVVRKDNGDGTYQTETGWGDGDRMVERGNWATYFGIQFTCSTVPQPPGYSSETAFAYNCDEPARTCFIGMDDGAGGTFNRWGWTNGPLGPGTYYFDIYAGAGRCDIDNGTLVGLLTVDYDGTEATVTYSTCGNYTMTETHLYVGNEVLARDVNNEFTVAPGQYPDIHEDLENVQTDVHTVSVTGDIYVVAHAVVWGDYDNDGDCGTRGCVPPVVSCDATEMYGTSLDLGGDIYRIDPATGTKTLWLDIATQPVTPAISPINSSSPNGNAINGEDNRFYFTSFRDPGTPPNPAVEPSELYYVGLDDPTKVIHHAGTLVGHASDGTFYNGSYWYIGHGTNDLKEVTFNADGTIDQEISHGAISINYPYLGFGDIAFNCEGVLYLGATIRASGNTITGFLNATYDLGTGAFAGTEVSSSDFWGQLAFGTDGATLYGHAAGTGDFYVVNPDGSMTFSFSDGKFTDLASGLFQVQ